MEEKTGFVHLGPSTKSSPKGGGGGAGRKKKCKDFANFLSSLKDWLSQLLSDQDDREENSHGCLIYIFIYKKETLSPAAKSGESPTDGITQLLLKDLHLKECVQA